MSERHGPDAHPHTAPVCPWLVVTHLMIVSAIVVECGGDEDQAIGALLHDAAEDQGGQETLDEIRRRFGAEIVHDCTDAATPLADDGRKPPGQLGSRRRVKNSLLARKASISAAIRCFYA